jgi:hypothetical protein
MKIKENRQKLKNPKFEKNEKQNFKKWKMKKLLISPNWKSTILDYIK